MNKLPIKETKLIAVYGRVSTSAQEVQETIEAQLFLVREFAKERGWTIVKEYLDKGWSGDILARPSLDDLRLDATKKIWDAVLIHDPDRLGRRYYYQELIMDELKVKGIDTLFVTVPPIENGNDQLMYEVRGSFARYERTKISERFRMGKLSRLHQGNVLVSEAPYGYNYIPNSGKRGTIQYVVGHYEINTTEAEVVGRIFGWIANDGLTLRAVVRRLQELDIRPRKSKRGVWSTSTLSTLLRNQTYIGIAHWGASYAVEPLKPIKEQKYKKIKKTSRRMNPVAKWIPIKVPAIIDAELFHNAGQKLSDNFAVMGRNKKNNYLLAGRVWCPCGCRRTGEGPQNGKYLYYRCADRVNSFPLPRTCFERGINAKIADELVWQRIEKILSSPTLIMDQIDRWKLSHVDNEEQRAEIETNELKMQLAKLKIQEDKLIKAYSEEIITLEKLREMVSSLKEKASTLELRVNKENTKQAPKLEIATREDVELFAKGFTENLDGLSFGLKKAIIDKSIGRAISTEKGLHVHGLVNLQEINVKFITIYRNRRSPKCGKIDPV